MTRFVINYLVSNQREILFKVFIWKWWSVFVFKCSDQFNSYQSFSFPWMKKYEFYELQYLLSMSIFMTMGPNLIKILLPCKMKLYKATSWIFSSFLFPLKLVFRCGQKIYMSRKVRTIEILSTKGFS